MIRNGTVMATQPKALIFDCDGTLLLTADIHFAAIAKALDRQGLAITREWYGRQSGLGRIELADRIAEATGEVLDVSRFCSDSIAETIALAQDARPNPTVVAIARDTGKHLPKALATNSERLIVSAFLQATGLAGCFDVIVTRDDVRQPKPDPEVFLLAAEKLGVGPDHCLVFEDSPEGMAAAASAGMKSVDVTQTANLAALI
jgi:HAD superfamily hydrolase (TIGR01509 family)